MEFNITELTNSYIWNTFSKPSQVTSLIMRMNCNQKEESSIEELLDCNQKTGNTETRVRQDGSRIVDVFLHGNLICSYDPTFYDNQKLKLFSAGYYTKTTKERLNAILHLHTNGQVRIKQVRGKWIVSDSRTNVEINFYDGMVVFQNHRMSMITDDKQMEFSIV